MGNVWVWVGLSWTDRVRLVLDQYGDRLTDVSIFGWRVSATGELVQTFDPAILDVYRLKWPHIRWWGCFRNMDDPDNGPYDIFESLRDSAGARGHLADEVEAKMFSAYPWLHGVDIDMETGGDFRSADSEEVFSAVAARAHSLGRKASAALPPLTATGSIGGENWVRYKQLGAFLDHVSVMSYDFAWSGSAPGPVSPGFWLENVYDWAASQISPTKLSMGLPLYSYFWSIHEYPGGDGRRGQSGTYYAMWQYFTGGRPWSETGTHHPIGWLTYREPRSMSGWGFMDCYDWRDSQDWAASSGVFSDDFQGRDYTVRYGLPAGSPQWSVSDNSVGSAHIDYGFNAQPVVSATGATVSPKVGYTLTAELVQRAPVAATIIDDYATSKQQLDNVYYQPSGAWSYKDVAGDYSQYRGSGELLFRHAFGAQALYVQARFQFATAGRFGVQAGGITADVSNGGQLRILKGSEVLAEKSVTPRPVGAAAQSGRTVLGLRVREGTARAYYSTAETSVPLELKVDVAPVEGAAGYSSTGTAWIDHVYLGDGWWYQPREAFEVSIGGTSKVLGRLDRSGVTWDSSNRFRPDTDVDEQETRSGGFSQDWIFEHWRDFPITTGKPSTVTVRPLDHDMWLGRLMIVDRDGASIVYFSDAETITHWRGRAGYDWGLQGVALWSLGQEDVRVWDSLEGGELTQATKRKDV